MFDIVNKIRRYKNRKLWRKMNPHNETIISGEYDPRMIKVGKATYGGINFLSFDRESRLIIGNYCSIAPNVVFIISADHYLDHISTFPFKAKITHACEFEGVSKGDIIVDDDVWIGYGAIILSGIHIGQGAVIGAGAVVTKDVPPYAIVGGNPAKIIRYRFDDSIIKELIAINFDYLDENTIIKNEKKLYLKILNKEDVEEWRESLMGKNL